MGEDLVSAAEEATLTMLAAQLHHDVNASEYVAHLRHLAAECDRDISAETAHELGIAVPECARVGWTPMSEDIMPSLNI